MTTSVEVYYSFQSPYSYLALDTVYSLERTYDIELLWQPFSARAAGQQQLTGAINPDKLSYIFEDTRRFAENHNLPLVFPESWPELEFDPSRITRGAIVAADMGILLEYNYKVFHRCWGLGQNPNDDNFMNELCDELDIDIGEFLSKVSSSDTRERVKGIYKRGKKLGIFDVPTIVVDKDRYFGLDKIERLHSILEKKLQTR